MSTLPDEIRLLPDLLDPHDNNDAVYQGLVTVILSLVYLNAGILQEGTSIGDLVDLESLKRYFRYLSIEENTPIMSTEKLLQTMIKQGYIDKVQDTASGELRHDFHLGPRGKVEVGKQGTLDFIKKVLKTEVLLTIGVR
jgi:hypothetical protein